MLNATEAPTKKRHPNDTKRPNPTRQELPVRYVVCSRCHRNGGTLVRVGNEYQHKEC